MGFDNAIGFLYDGHVNEGPVQSVSIQFQYRKRRKETLVYAGSKTLTIRGFDLDSVYQQIAAEFRNELSDAGVYERPQETVSVILQHWRRPGKKGAMDYQRSRTLTIRNVSLDSALKRITALFRRF
ncbi:MAG TPA: hypothetical protein VNL14_16485 [Candidatus Acidoferrales bacterium]|nr:hypothetical protein [Candidatus Acidoferrales bacterium]